PFLRSREPFRAARTSALDKPVVFGVRPNRPHEGRSPDEVIHGRSDALMEAPIPPAPEPEDANARQHADPGPPTAPAPSDARPSAGARPPARSGSPTAAEPSADARPPADSGPAAHARATAISRRDRVYAMAGVLLALLLSGLDQTIVATAGPEIQRDLSIPASLYAWLTTSYLVASTVMLPIYGKLSDIYGRKPILLVGVVLFLTGSVVAGLSPNTGVLIVGRTVQ